MQLVFFLIVFAFFVCIYAIFKGINMLVYVFYTPDNDEVCYQEYLLKREKNA